MEGTLFDFDLEQAVWLPRGSFKLPGSYEVSGSQSSQVVGNTPLLLIQVLFQGSCLPFRLAIAQA